MDPNRFDQISRRFSDMRLSRRTALGKGAGLAAGGGAALAGIAVTAAQDATPVPDATPMPIGNSALPPDDGVRITHLFVQAYQSGSIAPIATPGGTATHTVTLEQGLGQTVYFADRPSREVGTSPTPAFLDGLGFVDDNPPNAAMLIETGPGEIDIAVVELFNPTYDDTSNTATYDIAVLADWKNDIEMGFQEAPTDLSKMATSFGATHLFIDDCRDRNIECYNLLDNKGYIDSFPGQGYCYWWSHASCLPCLPRDAEDATDIQRYWDKMCNESFPACGGDRCQSEWH